MIITTLIMIIGSIVMGYSGTFQVCWCGEKHSDANGCTQNSDFNIFVGNIVVGGPVQGTIVYAPLGAPFDYSINGWGMSDVDRISIVDNDVLCASSRANVYSTGVSIVSSPQGYPPFYKVGPSVNNRTQITWRNIVLTKLAQYKVCWCARNFNNCATGAIIIIILSSSSSSSSSRRRSSSSSIVVPAIERDLGHVVDAAVNLGSSQK